ncbi:hypothetical protein DV701_04350 [Ornithinimicrobium avium]|uniref:Uncharacterized protein n=1 Tax=Ornithinimicrobium avium TaxID=2283195 RepID=A0A345NKA4_9MICO|nr:hypothetical protein DV701_04350 [Ornithinimicrobium avium]
MEEDHLEVLGQAGDRCPQLLEDRLGAGLRVVDAQRGAQRRPESLAQVRVAQSSSSVQTRQL